MRVRGSEIGTDYVRRLRDMGRSWSVIARMTGASETDLRRFHGGQGMDGAVPMPAGMPVAAIKAVPRPVVVYQPAMKVPFKAEVEAKPKPKAPPKAVNQNAKRKAIRANAKADGRLSSVLVAAGMGSDEAGVVVRMYRAGGTRQVAAALLPEDIQSPALIKQRMAEVKKSAARLGIQFSGGRGGYCLRPDSMHFVGRLETVNCGGAR